jgi:multimeric flavodoxin WrbA
MALRVLCLNCSLKTSDLHSNTQVLVEDIVEQMRQHDPDLAFETVRVADHNVPPGVTLDEGGGDAWPSIATRLLEADVVIFAVPIWLGHPSSVAQRVLERMDHWLFHMNERGMKPMYGKVAAVAITGNEDGGHHVYAEMFQALSDLGFTLPPEARSYWTGWSDKAPETSYPKSGRQHPMTNYMTEHCARNLVHFGRAVKELEPHLPQLQSDIEAAGRDPLEVAQRATRLHD